MHMILVFWSVIDVKTTAKALARPYFNRWKKYQLGSKCYSPGQKYLSAHE